MPDPRKPLLSPEETAFIKSNGFQRSADALPPPPTPAPAPEPAKPSGLPVRPPKERTVRVTVDLRESQHRRLKEQAAKVNYPLTDILRHVISVWLDEQDQP